MRCKRAARRRCGQSAGVTLIVTFALGACFAPAEARAQGLRLRGDAIAESQSPAGLVVLQGEDKARPWLDAEGLVWAGARTGVTSTTTPREGADPAADVLVLAVRLRDPRGFGELRAGRFVVATGAIRPVQVDGASGLARAPWGSTAFAFGGAPVVPRFGERAYDWLAGGRVAQHVLSAATLGGSYVQRRTHGEIADHEVGADFAMLPARWLDVAARGAYDLTSPGVADALVSTAFRFEPVRVELFGTHRSPSRLLPATSLFSVLGDFPSEMAGTTVRWFAAPRLDVLASGAFQAVGGEVGGNGSLRGVLRLDDRGDGQLGLEARRQDVATAAWTGARAIAAQPLGRGFRASTELEIAFPDHPRGKGSVWPWGLLALAWRSPSGWEAAGAVEAASTPQHAFEFNGLVRVSRALELR